ncbi:hypothetical protein BJ944DRAFT_4890 [Cunninghamella echinulata]|nr:hypothetical protein BJ944DRAFT_4890 [Cunninghamella echinulata]
MATVTSNRKDDWRKEFYKNGYPKEVIVIEDSPTPPKTPEKVHNKPVRPPSIITISDGDHLPPAASTRSKRNRRDLDENQKNTSQQKQKQYISIPTPPSATATIKKRRKINPSQSKYK